MNGDLVRLSGLAQFSAGVSNSIYPWGLLEAVSGCGSTGRGWPAGRKLEIPDLVCPCK